MSRASERGRIARELARVIGNASEDLADAALLAANGRRNAALLTQKAMRHALQAVSLSEGLDAGEDPPISEILRRVPPDHLLAKDIGAVGTPPFLDGVGRLVSALADAFGVDPARPDRPAAHTGPLRAPEPEPEPQPKPDPNGPTTLSFSARSQAERAKGERARTLEREESYPGAAFWALVDRWKVPDLDALALIGHEGGQSKSGTRPRFRLHGNEAHRFAGLRAIDTALATMGIPASSWLGQPQETAPYGGHTPLRVLQEGGADGAAAIHHQLTREGLSRALAQTDRQPDEDENPRQTQHRIRPRQKPKRTRAP